MAIIHCLFSPTSENPHSRDIVPHYDLPLNNDQIL